jgi:hypothetical protein
MNGEELKKTMQDDPNTWMTLRELSSKTNLPESDIQKVIRKSNLFVQSSSLNAANENVFSTRQEFQTKSSLTNKIIGAFKNRID